MASRILRGDVLSFARHWKGERFHALLTDPPYHLTSITKRFGKEGSAEVKVKEFFDSDGNSKGNSPYKHTSTGFMGKRWDGGDIAFRPETWAVFSDLLYPGAFGMAFASSRGWHRLAVAIEDAGFVIHPSVFLWNFSTGFPKATRIKGHKEFDGHRYGLQSLKPAGEPLITFSKPSNLFCGILVEDTFLMEILLCILSNARDAEMNTNPLHRVLKVAVDNFVRGNVDVLVSLENVKIARGSSGSSQTRLDLPLG